MSTYQICSAALSARLYELQPDSPRIPDHAYYTVNLEDNLLNGAASKLFRTEYNQGAGQELEWTTNRFGVRQPPKMHAAYSSSALVVNTFASWKSDPALLSLASETGFDNIRFEARCPTGLRGVPPHLDVLATVKKRLPVGLESKCIEFLARHGTDFARSYDSLSNLRAAKPYFDLIGPLRENSDEYEYLDAPQLICMLWG